MQRFAENGVPAVSATLQSVPTRISGTLRLRIPQSHPRLVEPEAVISELREKLQNGDDAQRYVALVNLSARLPGFGCLETYKEVVALLLRLLSHEQNEVSLLIADRCRVAGRR
jgi:hypothetical protein